MSGVPVTLPILTGPHGTRSAMTCQYRCGFACARPMPNTSDAEHIGDLLTRALTRRATADGDGAATAALVLDLTLCARTSTPEEA
jgi:hypothetical protein